MDTHVRHELCSPVSKLAKFGKRCNVSDLLNMLDRHKDE